VRHNLLIFQVHSSVTKESILLFALGGIEKAPGWS
jgi:hypothetical protein